MKKVIFILLLLGVRLAARDFDNCSAISLTSGDTVILGRNHDERLSNCLLVFNPRNLVKKGFEFGNEPSPVWTAKYASLTFNILGVGYAILGMNEEGLAMGHLGFREAQYPPRDERPVLDQIQFISYILDNSANTPEVIQRLDSVRISDESVTREHYFVGDRTGKLAILEFIAGKLVLYTNESIPYPVLSNDNYQTSLAYLKNYAGFGGKKPIPEKNFGVEEIMAIGATQINSFNTSRKRDIIHSAFSILNDIGFNKYPPPAGVVVHPNYGTQFTVVFDLKNLTIYFQTKSNRNIRRIDFNDFNPAGPSGIKILEIEKTTAGNVNHLFSDYSIEKNRNYLSEWSRQANSLPAELIEFLCTFADSFLCK